MMPRLRVDGEFSIKGVDRCEDMKLGIEALKCVKECRRLGTIHYIGLLPGEAEE